MTAIGNPETNTETWRNHTPKIHPGRLTWNIIMEVWKIIFLSKWLICRFHVNLPGCKRVCKLQTQIEMTQNHQKKWITTMTLSDMSSSQGWATDFQRGFHHSSTSLETPSFSRTTICDFPSSSSSTKKIQPQKNINANVQISPPTSAQNGPLPNPKWPAKGFSSVRSQPSGGVARHLDGFWCFGVFKTWWFKYQVFHCRQTSKLA